MLVHIVGGKEAVMKSDGRESSIERKSKRLTRSERRGIKARMKEILLLVPRLLKLLVRLVRDPRVARADKVILGGTILYAIVPLDFIPDMIPFIGQIDDSYLIAISILRMLNRAEPGIVAEHWDGDVDIKKLATSIVSTASFLLPAGIRSALTERLEVREPKPLRVVSQSGGK
jgi:uncharacterized membrane protein YkvA (DUF1232 family)